MRIVERAGCRAYGLATEADTLLRVEDGTLPDERLDTTGTTVDLVEGDLTNDLAAIFPVYPCELESMTSYRACTDFLSVLTFSMFSGILAAKVSFKLCDYCQSH